MGYICASNDRSYINAMVKPTKKQQRGVRRQVDLDLGVNAPKSGIHKNKKKYTRKDKHKDGSLSSRQSSNK